MSALLEAGGDTDSISFIAGQIAGVHIGFDGVPKDWLALLPERAMVQSIAEIFADVCHVI